MNIPKYAYVGRYSPDGPCFIPGRNTKIFVLNTDKKECICVTFCEWCYDTQEDLFSIMENFSHGHNIVKDYDNNVIFLN